MVPRIPPQGGAVQLSVHGVLHGSRSNLQRRQHHGHHIRVSVCVLLGARAERDVPVAEILHGSRVCTLFFLFFFFSLFSFLCSTFISLLLFLLHSALSWGSLCFSSAAASRPPITTTCVRHHHRHHNRHRCSPPCTVAPTTTAASSTATHHLPHWITTTTTSGIMLACRVSSSTSFASCSRWRSTRTHCDSGAISTAPSSASHRTSIHSSAVTPHVDVHAGIER
jgi:hypothetical protein